MYYLSALEARLCNNHFPWIFQTSYVHKRQSNLVNALALLPSKCKVLRCQHLVFKDQLEKKCNLLLTFFLSLLQSRKTQCGTYLIKIKVSKNRVSVDNLVWYKQDVMERTKWSKRNQSTQIQSWKAGFSKSQLRWKSLWLMHKESPLPSPSQPPGW